MHGELKKSINKYIQALPLRYQHIYVHPCVINKNPCIIYPLGLKQHSPSLYKELDNHFSDQGFTLKEEQRADTPSIFHSHDRRRWMPMLLFAVSLLFENMAAASTIASTKSIENGVRNSHKIELRFIPTTNIASQHQSLISNKYITPRTQSLKSHTAVELYSILNEHYIKNVADPVYIQKDFKSIANYYSRFPEVVSLILSLKKKEWTLSYDENVWSTVANGSILQVNSAVINFNTRSAAKLKLHNSCKENPVCIASPADALLHELLHTHSMLVKTDEFISQGGMNMQHYPYQHEYAIIKSERKLYASMSKSDAIKRPQRNEHAGRKVIASCVTCIK